jgi:hypothetical protein
MEGIYNRELGIDAGAGEDNLLTYCRLSGTRYAWDYTRASR